MKNITVSDIKKNNLSLIYNLIYSSVKCSKQEIASQLKLSLPTVSEKILKLQDQGLITKGGHFESTVGRRAVAYSICMDARISIGVRINTKKIKILSVDLKGNICGSISHVIEFSDNNTYYKEVAYLIKDFILEKNYLTDQILGIGFAMSGLTSVDRTKITFGKTLGFSGLKITVFSQYLNYPCSFFHDAKCAATAELWFNKNINDALYLSIEKYLGGAIIKNREILLGENGHSGAIEHMLLIPNGNKCYCGNSGCIETYCSINALLMANEKISDFFDSLRDGIPQYLSRWNEYLNNLATVLNNVHILLDRDIILGGKLSQYLIEEDLNKLKEMTNSKTVFRDKNTFFYVSNYPKHSASVGASLYYIKDFINKI